MNKNLKLLLIVVLLIIITVAFFLIKLYKDLNKNDFCSTRNILLYSIIYKDFNDTIFVYTQTTGFSGSNDYLSFSNKKFSGNILKNNENLIIFNTSKIYFKNIRDSLIIIANKIEKIPPDFKSKIKIIQVNINEYNDISKLLNNADSLDFHEVWVGDTVTKFVY
jgi:uncharacterized protein (UPF0333 family)